MDMEDVVGRVFDNPSLYGDIYELAVKSELIYSSTRVSDHYTYKYVKGNVHVDCCDGTLLLEATVTDKQPVEYNVQNVLQDCNMIRVVTGKTSDSSINKTDKPYYYIHYPTALLMLSNRKIRSLERTIIDAEWHSANQPAPKDHHHFTRYVQALNPVGSDRSQFVSDCLSVLEQHPASFKIIRSRLLSGMNASCKGATLRAEDFVFLKDSHYFVEWLADLELDLQVLLWSRVCSLGKDLTAIVSGMSAKGFNILRNNLFVYLGRGYSAFDINNMFMLDEMSEPINADDIPIVVPADNGGFEPSDLFQ